MAALLSEMAEKVATPPTADTVSVPASVELPGFAVSASVTGPVNEFATLPSASFAVTTSAGLNAVPATVLAGGATVKKSATGAAALMLNVVVVTPVRPALDALSV